MKKFLVKWEVEHSVIVKARNEEEAILKIENKDYPIIDETETFLEEEEITEL